MNILVRAKYNGIIRIKALTRFLNGASHDLIDQMLNKSPDKQICIPGCYLSGPLFQIYKCDGDIGWWFGSKYKNTQYYDNVVQAFINSLNRHVLNLTTKNFCLVIKPNTSRYLISNTHDMTEGYGCQRCGDYAEECNSCGQNWCDDCFNHRCHYCRE